MQFANKVQKSKGQFSGSGNKSLQNRPNSQKPGKPKGVRTTSISKMTEIFLTYPDTVTREEFNEFQRAVGYRRAIGLLEEGRRRKELRKIDKIDEQEKHQSIEEKYDRHSIEKISEKEQKGGQTEDKSSVKAETALKAEEKPANEKHDRKDIGTVNQEKKSEKSQKEEIKEAGKAEPQISADLQKKNPNKPENTKAGIKSSADKQSLQAKEQANIAKDEKTSSQQNKKDTVIQKESENQNQNARQNQEKPATVAVGKKQPSPASEGISKAIAGLGAAAKNAKKAPQVNIKMGEPGDILKQMENVSPTQVLHAYSQASDISKASLEKQTQKTQAVLPKVPAPTGLAPVKKGSIPKNKVEAIKRAEPADFKGVKTGGKDSTIGDINIGSENEPDPEEIMAEAKKYSANAPSVSLDGEADPSQTGDFNAEATQTVEAAKQEELNQLNNEFGENSIFPAEDNSVLMTQKALNTKQTKINKVSKTLNISADMEAQMNKTLAPDFKAKVGEQQSKYSAGKEKFDTDVAAARTDSDNQITQLKENSKNRQQEQQAGAKAEVERLKGQWKDEVNQAVSEYDSQAEAETKSKTSEISKVKEQKDKEVKEKLAKAENDANTEYKTAKKNADDKKNEKEKEHENEKKSWLEKAGDWLAEKANQFIEGLKKLVNFIFEGLRKAVKAIFEAAKAAVVGLIELGRQLVVNIIKGLGAILKTLVKAVFAKFPGIANKICGFIDKTVNKAVQVVNTIADGLKKGVSAVLDALASTVDALLGTIQYLYNQALNVIGIIAGKLAEIMAGIARLGAAAKASLPHIEGKLWEQLIGADITQPMGDEASEQTPEAEATKDSANEKLTENDVEIESVQTGEIDSELLQDMKIKDGETKYVEGSKNPETVDSIMNDFDAGKEAEKKGNSLADAVKTRAENAAKLLDQIKEFVIKWLKENWLKLLLGVTGALAGVILLNILTGGAITAALPIIMEVIVNVMNAASIVEAVTTAAKHIATYLSQGWAGNLGAAAPALATALAIGLLALAAVVTSKLKKAGVLAKAGAKGNAAKKAITTGVKNTAKAAVKGIKDLIKSGKKLISKSGKFLIEKGKLVIKRLGNIFPKGMKKLKDLTGRVLAKFKFKGFEFKLEGKYLLIYGIFNPKKLIDKIKIKDAGVSKATKGMSKSGTDLARQLGKEGEDAAGIVNAKQRIPSLSGTAKYRIPDELLQDQKILREIKNVSSQSYTNQLKDFNAWAKQNNGYQFILEVRPGAKLSGPLQEAINNGEIILKNIGK
ncbi:MAG TPA: putative toxin [Ruminiclostridium sp.]|nr:putative toxin [Ruminiclostridium sp.]